MSLQQSEPRQASTNPYAPPKSNSAPVESGRKFVVPILLLIGTFGYAWLTWELFRASPSSPDRKASYLFMPVLAYLVIGSTLACFRCDLLPRIMTGAVFAQVVVLAAMLIQGIGDPSPVLMINGIIVAAMLIIGTISVARLRNRKREKP